MVKVRDKMLDRSILNLKRRIKQLEKRGIGNEVMKEKARLKRAERDKVTGNAP